MNRLRDLPAPALLCAVLAVAAVPAWGQLRVPMPGSPGGAGATGGSGGFQVPRGAESAPLAPAGAAPPAAAPAGPVHVDRVVAVVNSEAITDVELQRRARSIARRLKSQGVDMPPASELEKQVLERMIQDRAQLQAAREAGVRVDEVMVDRAIGRMADENKMTVAQLRSRVELDGTPYTVFREEIAQEIAVSRLRERDIDAKIQVSEAEIDAFLAEQAKGGGGVEEFNIAQIVVRLPDDPPPDVVERQRLRAEAIAAEARRGADFARLAANLAESGEGIAGGVIGMRPADRLPQLFVQAVESLKPGEVGPVVRSPAGFHVLKLLERRSPGASTLASKPVEQTKARHILIRTNEVVSEAEALRRLGEIKLRIEGGGADFVDMARQYSNDGSAGQGGDLGWIYPGDTVPEFERAMAALKPMQISDPVRTPFGYHLIQVLERRTDEASPDRVRAAARQAVRERKISEAFQEWTRQIRDRAYVVYRLDER